MTNKLDKLDSETRDIIAYLESREEVCDIKINETYSVSSSQLNDWENRNLCSLPQDLRNFYSNHNGISIEWSVKIDDYEPLRLGRIQINSIKDLTKVGSVLSKDLREPSIFDLEDLQSPPKFASRNSMEIKSLLPEINELGSGDAESLSELSDEENSEHKNNTKILIPHFDDLSRNFELDNCNGYGKVCLVYRNAKPGMMVSEQSAEIWFLDRSLQWHFLTDSFKNYYRLAISHLGLPQWHMLYTQDGLPPFLNQWFYMFCPGRILVHQEEWKNSNFLSLIDNFSNSNNKKPLSVNQEDTKKIDFAKLFEDKNTKKSTSQAINQNSTNSLNKPEEKSVRNNTSVTTVKPKSRFNSNEKMRFEKIFLLALALCENFVVNFCSDIDPYHTLGVSRNADERKIKDAYRKKAKDWHPDRNKSPEAHEKFMQINKAYEILSDSERRSLYDEYGTTNEPRHDPGAGFHRENFDNFFRDPFEGFFGGGFGFNQKKNSRKNPEEEINKRIYLDTVLPNSYTKPYLIYVYTEFCFSCITVENLWQALRQELKNIGFGVGHSDASWNRELNKLLEVRKVPTIVAVINGRVRHFRGDYNLREIREFVRNLLPSRLITQVNQFNFNKTVLETIQDNKVFSLFISHSNHVSLRYQMPCFQMVKNFKCASVLYKNIESEFKNHLSKNFKIPMDLKQETLILFKENVNPDEENQNVHRPFLIQALTELNYEAILQSLENNKHLILPRISSGAKFFDLCPSLSEFEVDTSKGTVCSVFLANSELKKPQFLFNNELKNQFLKNLQGDKFLKKLNIQLSYVYLDVQTNFADRIRKNARHFEITVDKILILRRLNDKYVEYDFIDDLSINEKNMLDLLKDKLNDFKNGNQYFRFKMSVPTFYEESNQDYFSFAIENLELIWDYLTDWIFWERLLGNSSYLMIILCTFLFLWLMIMFSSEKSDPITASRHQRFQRNNVNKEPDSRNQSFNQSKSFSSTSSQNTSMNGDDLYDSRYDDFNKNTSNQFQIVEMNPKTFHGLVNSVPKGFRTILLIANQNNKTQLLEIFTKVCMKYNNKTYKLRFGYLNRDSAAGKKWLEEVASKCKIEKKNLETDSENSSDLEDFENLCEKSAIDLNADSNLLAINPSQKSFLSLNLYLNDADESYFYLNGKSENLSEERLSVNLEKKLMADLSNWFDKFIDGMLANKITVKQWPIMYL
ncbi:dnaJ -like protein [Brachionus plicatilis]|uniref:DnaJ homolog subfamily C member 16 n=1 Tax=Brachionus plicatilis TaxID=10195 RepID=A0A3M7QWR1_BRAPC|nr:dnaJ -like protein [Brachionus plicatilis]